MKEEFIFSGFGGQGIQFVGQIFAFALMRQGLHVTFMPSYGAEVRGGTAHCHVIFSDGVIASPVIEIPTAAVTLNRLAMEKFEPKVRAGGLLVLNSSITDVRPKRADIQILEVPATQLADSLGDIRVANMVILGATLAVKPVCTLSHLEKCLDEFLPARKKENMAINVKALRAGYQLHAPAAK